MTKVDSLGKKLITDQAALAVADFTQKYPMQPRNPGTGFNSSQQLQAWIAGPEPQTGKAVVVLANYGPDQGQGGFGTKMPGKRTVSVSWDDLGIGGTYSIKDVWSGTSKGKSDSGVSAVLGAGESQLLWLIPGGS
jgi:alpha-galactosidase